MDERRIRQRLVYDCTDHRTGSASDCGSLTDIIVRNNRSARASSGTYARTTQGGAAGHCERRGGYKSNQNKLHDTILFETSLFQE